MFSVTFDFECTYIKEVQYNCSAPRSVHCFIIEISSYSHQEQKEALFFILFYFSNFFPCIQTEYEKILIWRDTRIQSECGKWPATLLKRDSNTDVFL